MNLPNPYIAYDNVAEEVKRAILQAREGKFREGFITVIIRSLTMLKEFAVAIGKSQGEVQTIERLLQEFNNMMHQQNEEKEKTSALGELV